MSRLLSPMSALSVIILGPALGFFAVLVTLMVSTRVPDPRTAHQLSGLLVLPMVLLMGAQSLGWLWMSNGIVVVGGGHGLKTRKEDETRFGGTGTASRE